MANKRISQLDALAAQPADDDLAVIVDVSEDPDVNKKITMANLFAGLIAKAIGTAAGDIIYFSGNATPARLAKGSDGQVLTLASGLPSWATPGGGTITGSILMWGTTSAPTGFLLCDGSAVSRTTYADLFAVIGTTFGSGDGSTTFNLPNLKGKVPVGYNSAETEFDAMGESGGEKTHQLTVAELAAHTHTYSPRPTGTNVQNTGSYSYISVVNSAETGSAGSDTPHNNLQPYLTLCFIIKY